MVLVPDSVGAFIPDMTLNVSTVTTWTYILAFLIAIAAVTILIVFRSQFKIDYRIRAVTGSSSYIIQDYAKEFKDDKGIPWWRLLYSRQVVPPAPVGCINLGKNGKRHVEAYRTESGQYTYIKDTCNLKETDIAFQPFTTAQRQVLSYQYLKAVQKKGVSWKEQLPQIVAVTGLVILVVVIVFFWKDITAPSVEVAHTNAEISKMNAELYRELRNEKNNVQTPRAIVPGGG